MAFVESAWQRHLRLAMLLTGDRWQAEELLQDSLVRMYERWRKLSRYDDLDAYLRRVLANNHTSIWRRRRRENLVPDVPERAAPSGFDSDIEVRQALMSLPPRQRAVVVLRLYEDLSERQTAETPGCSVGTVKSQYARALDKMDGEFDSVPPTRALLCRGARARRRRTATTAVAASFAAVAAIAVGGLVVTSAGHPTTSGRRDAGTAAPAPAMQLAAAVTASQSTSYRLTITTGTPADPDAWGTAQGAYDPATATGYLDSVQKDGRGYDHQRLVNGTLYVSRSGTKRWKQVPNHAFEYGDALGGASGVSANPDDLFAAMREQHVTTTRTGDRTYHFVSIKNQDTSRVVMTSTLTGDVTLDPTGRIAQVSWQQTVTSKFNTGVEDRSATAVGTVALSDYGMPVRVEKPTDVAR